MKYNVAYLGENKDIIERLSEESSGFNIFVIEKPYELNKFKGDIDLFIYEETEQEDNLYVINNLVIGLKNSKFVFFVIRKKLTASDYLKCGIHDVYNSEFDIENLRKRLEFLKTNYDALLKVNKDNLQSFKLPLWKRVFDIIFASTVLLFLSPIFLVIIIAIRIESKGKFYYA